MARDSTGPKGEPQYDTLGQPADAADLTELGAYAALTGNRKVDVSSVRIGLTGTNRWVGLEFEETDTGLTYVWTSGGWAQKLSGPAGHAASGGGVPSGIALPSGNVDLPRGIQFRTGVVTSGTSVSFGNEYFPVAVFRTPFPTSCLGVYCTPLSNSPTTKTGGAISLDGVSANQFRALIPESANPWIRSFSYLAVGY